MSSHEAQPSLRLTAEDVERLLREESSAARAQVASKIAHQHAEGHFSFEEMAIAAQIFKLLLKDSAVSVRTALAEGLKEDAKAPKSVILALSADVKEVALPVLEHSPVLDEADLVRIIQEHRDITRHIAIARRKVLPALVSEALVETGEGRVVETLLKNPEAVIASYSFRRIAAGYKNEPSVLEQLVKHGNLPLEVAAELVEVVSDTLADELKKRFDSLSGAVDQQAKKAKETQILSLLDDTVDENAVINLVAQLRDAGRLTPSLILTALCRGNFTFFEVALAQCAHIPVANARKLINDRGALGFIALYKKAELPETLFQACNIVLQVMRELKDVGELNPKHPYFANRVVERIFHKTHGNEVENIAYIIALIRQNFRN